MDSKALGAFRYLSLPIALKRDFSTVYLTVNPVPPEKKGISFKCLHVPETIEWE
jgi:hypothetical protein